MLKKTFFDEFGCDTNDILTLYSYWQVNFRTYSQRMQKTPHPFTSTIPQNTRNSTYQPSFDNRTMTAS